MLAMLIPILLSIGAINAFIPLLIVIILIAAAGASMRGYNIFAIFGISTLIGIGSATGSKLKNPAKTLLGIPRYSGKGFSGGIKAGIKKTSAAAKKRAVRKAVERAVTTGDMTKLTKTLKEMKLEDKLTAKMEKNMSSGDASAMYGIASMNKGLKKLDKAGRKENALAPIVTESSQLQKNLPYPNSFSEMKRGHLTKGEIDRRVKLAVPSPAPGSSVIERMKASRKRSKLKRAELHTVGFEDVVEARKKLLDVLISNLKQASNKYIAAKGDDKRQAQILDDAQRMYRKAYKNTLSNLGNELLVMFGTGTYKIAHDKITSTGNPSKARKAAGVAAGIAAATAGTISGYNFIPKKANADRLAKMYRYRGGVEWGNNTEQAASIQGGGPGAASILQNKGKEETAREIAKEKEDDARKKVAENQASKERIARDEKESRERTARDEEESRKRVAQDEEASKKRQKKSEEGK